MLMRPNKAETAVHMALRMRKVLHGQIVVSPAFTVLSTWLLLRNTHSQRLLLLGHNWCYTYPSS